MCRFFKYLKNNISKIAIFSLIACLLLSVSTYTIPELEARGFSRAGKGFGKLFGKAASKAVKRVIPKTVKAAKATAKAAKHAYATYEMIEPILSIWGLDRDSIYQAILHHKPKSKDPKNRTKEEIIFETELQNCLYYAVEQQALCQYNKVGNKVVFHLTCSKESLKRDPNPDVSTWEEAPEYIRTGEPLVYTYENENPKFSAEAILYYASDAQCIRKSQLHTKTPDRDKRIPPGETSCPITKGYVYNRQLDISFNKGDPIFFGKQVQSSKTNVPLTNLNIIEKAVTPDPVNTSLVYYFYNEKYENFNFCTDSWIQPVIKEPLTWQEQPGEINGIGEIIPAKTYLYNYQLFGELKSKPKLDDIKADFVHLGEYNGEFISYCALAQDVTLTYDMCIPGCETDANCSGFKDSGKTTCSKLLNECIKPECTKDTDCSNDSLGLNLCDTSRYKCYKECDQHSDCPTNKAMFCLHGKCGSCSAREGCDCIDESNCKSGGSCLRNEQGSFCGYCQSDNDCKNSLKGEFCRFKDNQKAPNTKICGPPECTTTDDCSGGQICSENKCTNCTDTTQCTGKYDGRICQDYGKYKICRPCNDTKECLNGKVCKMQIDSKNIGFDIQMKKCVDCSYDTECIDPLNPVCTKGTCSKCTDTKQCRTNINNKDKSCDTGNGSCSYCLPGIDSTSKCLPGEICDTKTWLCDTKTCNSDFDCPGTNICINNQCTDPVRCISGLNCPDELVCKDGICNNCDNTESGKKLCYMDRHGTCIDGNCKPCETNSQCPIDKVCHDDGQCWAKSCSTDDECSDGKYCSILEGKCFDIMQCNTTADCVSGLLCIDNACRACTNETKEQCYQYYGNTCINNFCANCDPSITGQCPIDTECRVDGMCLAKSCKSDNDCSSSKICKLGKCNEPIPCGKSNECSTGDLCIDKVCRDCDDSTKSQCKKDYGNTCIDGDCKSCDPKRTDQCPDNTYCSTDGKCQDPSEIQCKTHFECPDGLLCNDGVCSNCTSETNVQCLLAYYKACTNGKCQECDPLRNDQCADNAVCSQSGNCQPPSSCKTNDDCGYGLVCRNNQCASCTNDGLCADGLGCIEKNSDNENKKFYSHLDMVCGQCNNFYECKEGQACVDHHCTSCKSPNDCRDPNNTDSTENLACINGECKIGCDTYDQCLTGEVCRNSKVFLNKQRSNIEKNQFSNKMIIEKGGFGSNLSDQGICTKCHHSAFCMGNPNGESCINGKCSSCTDDSECEQDVYGSKCIDGVCGCKSDTHCEAHKSFENLTTYKISHQCINNRCDVCLSHDDCNGLICSGTKENTVGSCYSCKDNDYSYSYLCKERGPLNTSCLDGKCEQCKNNKQCKKDQYGSQCINGVCGCNSGNDCKDNIFGNKYCVAGECGEQCYDPDDKSHTFNEFMEYRTCTGNQICSKGNCIDQCSVDRPCSDGLACIDGNCKKCSNNNECKNNPNGEICISGTCYQCTDNKDCPANSLCSIKGQCIEKTPELCEKCDAKNSECLIIDENRSECYCATDKLCIVPPANNYTLHSGQHISVCGRQFKNHSEYYYCSSEEEYIKCDDCSNKCDEKGHECPDNFKCIYGTCISEDYNVGNIGPYKSCFNNTHCADIPDKQHCSQWGVCSNCDEGNLLGNTISDPPYITNRCLLNGVATFNRNTQIESTDNLKKCQFILPYNNAKESYDYIYENITNEVKNSNHLIPFQKIRGTVLFADMSASNMDKTDTFYIEPKPIREKCIDDLKGKVFVTKSTFEGIEDTSKILCISDNGKTIDFTAVVTKEKDDDSPVNIIYAMPNNGWLASNKFNNNCSPNECSKDQKGKCEDNQICSINNAKVVCEYECEQNSDCNKRLVCDKNKQCNKCTESSQCSDGLDCTRGTCVPIKCGDGVRDLNLGEDCDFGIDNTDDLLNNHGCTLDCKEHYDWSCSKTESKYNQHATDAASLYNDLVELSTKFNKNNCNDYKTAQSSDWCLKYSNTLSEFIILNYKIVADCTGGTPDSFKHIATETGQNVHYIVNCK